jgi:hypothetical protein
MTLGLITLQKYCLDTFTKKEKLLFGAFGKPLLIIVQFSFLQLGLRLELQLLLQLRLHASLQGRAWPQFPNFIKRHWPARYLASWPL